MPETIVIKGEGITLDLILWRKYGVRGRSLVEQTLDLNPGLSGLGAFLPLGTEVILPDLPAQQQISTRVVSLFG